MQIFSERRGRTFKTVTYIFHTTEVSDREVFIAALQHFNETPSSIFGHKVTRTGSVATVELFTGNEGTAEFVTVDLYTD